MADLMQIARGIHQGELDRHEEELAPLNLEMAGIKLQEARTQLQQQQTMMKMLGQSPLLTPQGGDPAEALPAQMDQLAELALKSGMLEKGKDYALAASTLRHGAQMVDTAKQEANLKALTMLGNLMQGVNDEQTWKAANAMFQLNSGRPSPYASLPYNPKIVDQIVNGVETAKEKALAKAAEARAKASDATRQEREARIPLIKAQTRLAETRDANLRKNGGAGLIPKAEDLRAVSDLLMEKYGGDLTPEHARVLARPVAEEAMELMRNEDLTRSEAAMRAFQTAEARGDFGGLRQNRSKAGSKNHPLEAPDDPKKLRPNMYYQGKGRYAGKVMRWTGAQFVEDSSDDEEDEDLEDEED